MKNLIFFNILISIFIIGINCQLDPIIIKGSNFTKDSITYIFDKNSNYFSKWEFTDVDLPFSCTNNTVIRTCVGSVNETIVKKFKGQILNCITSTNGASECNSFLWKDYYPQPIIDGEFKPPTKGGYVNIQGYYLVFGITKFTILPSTKVPIIGDLESSTIDITNLTLDYKGGCGPRTFTWPNNFNYTFNHQKPNISSVSSSDTKIIANGSNFCNIIDYVTIFIEGIKIDKSNITLIDHEIFEIAYIQPYSKSVSLHIISGGLGSNHVSFDYKPILNSANSVSKKYGGLITITGSRLSPPPSLLANSTILVKIGTYDCKNVTFINQQLICRIDPIINNGDSVNLPIKLTINSISNENKLLFSFDQPIITNIIIIQGEVKLSGNFFGTNETTQIFIDDVQQTNLKILVNENQTSILFKPNQITKSKINVVVNGLKSNIAEITSPFYSIQNPASPSVNGQIVNFTLYNINPLNYNSTPIITLQSDNSKITGIDLKNSTDFSKHTYSFTIPKGCGRNGFLISIGNDTIHSEFNYNLPIVNNCSIGNNQMIECVGQYQDFIDLYKSGKIKIIFSNSIIVDNVANISIKFTNSLISFPLKPEYGSSEFKLEVCNEFTVPLKVDISPSVDYFQTNPIFNSTGGSILIIGKNFVKETIENSHLHCVTNNLDYNCTFINFSTISCQMNINGPNDQYLEVVFNNKHENISIKFYPPLVLNTTISKSTGLVIITGNEFYKQIDYISIGYYNCSNISFINSSCITCLVEQQTNLIIDKLLFVNVIINGKSGGKELTIYNHDLLFSNNNNNNYNNNSIGGENNNSKISKNVQKGFIEKNGWVIAIIVIGVILVVGLVLNIKFKLYSKTSRILLKNRIKKNFKKNKPTKKSKNGNSINQSNDNILHSSIDSMSSPPLPPPQSRLQPSISPINSIDDFDSKSIYADQLV
ncbi:immunoglobulin E-set domain-containing protein [Dictyostelium discoideum AX4]|uniref:Immunoglobulin E-set domain-containing protein n=1 Tax=Dictyostelium discoideum TaxID=44689 RepID=Q8T298_DICDI|nr:immunoglobulin E-set domain-containing protein [Dictyostelium discoideum AX4]EAL70005.1 immunoglobulin E-set domain-containing protein [Dictyostelium discoideum AX4]|eukprot:XP_644243.1 immunoglobulin E-set domain-containing protein [Dictyostelium discoideum AX4]